MIDLSRPAAPSRPPRRDWFAPAVAAGSLAMHAALVAPLVWGPRAEAARPPAEIPIEVVQEPPKPPEKPAARPAKLPVPAPKPPEPSQHQSQANAPTEKPSPAKHAAAKEQSKQAAKQQAAKQQVAKEQAKPPEQNVAERMEKLIGPMRAMAMPSLTGGDNPLDDSISYRQLVLSQVARQKRDDRHDGVPGHAAITFTIGDHGEVLSCEVLEKSVDPNLDAEAVAMVYRGAPYPAPPPGAEHTFSFGLAFRTL